MRDTIVGQPSSEAHSGQRQLTMAWDMTSETEHLASTVTRLHCGCATLVQLPELSGLSSSCVHDGEEEKEAMLGK